MNADGQEPAARAEALLLACLTPAQGQSYQGKGWFDVTSSTGRRWRLTRHGLSYNAFPLPADSGGLSLCYCGHLPGGRFTYGDYPPEADHLIAQVLTLTADEGMFISIANEGVGTCPQDHDEAGAPDGHFRRFGPARAAMMGPGDHDEMWRLLRHYQAGGRRV